MSWSEVPTLEYTVTDTVGNALAIVFLGRGQIAGSSARSPSSVKGTVGWHADRLSMLNRTYEIVGAAPTDSVEDFRPQAPLQKKQGEGLPADL